CSVQALCNQPPATATVTVAPAQVVLQKAATASQVKPGATFDYTLTLKAQPDVIGYHLTDTLPAGVTTTAAGVIAPVQSAINVSPDGHTVDIVTQAPLPSGSVSFTIHATVDANAADGLVLKNIAQATAPGAAAQASNETDVTVSK